MGHINVDTDLLAKCLGLRRWPNNPDPLGDPQDWRRRMAARVITDALRPDDFREVKPEVAMSNAQYWIDRAYNEGFRRGIETERKRWEQKIKQIFGL